MCCVCLCVFVCACLCENVALPPSLPPPHFFPLSSSGSCSPPVIGSDWYLVRVELTVTDVNDNVPEWTMVPAPYLAVVSPDTPPGSLVYKLNARDGDEGNNGEVEYFLSDGKSLPVLCGWGRTEIVFFFDFWHPTLHHASPHSINNTIYWAEIFDIKKTNIGP